MTDEQVRAASAAERRELANVLEGLSPQQWDAPSLCQGWRVRDLVAHLTMPYRFGLPRFAGEMVRSGFRFNAMADRTARRDGQQLSQQQLVRSLRDNADHPWKPPGGGYAGALSHDVIHGLDATVALGLGRDVPLDRMRIVLEAFEPKRMTYFGIDPEGLRLQADDIGWSFGTGDLVEGRAQDLILAMCARRLPAGLVTGPGVGRMSADR